MLSFNRQIEQNFINLMHPNKAVILFGARRIGKTMFLKKLLPKLNEKYLMLNGEDISTSEMLERRSAEYYKQILGDTNILIIDEAQRIQDISLKVKLMLDEIEGLKVILSGSSALDLGNNIGEPLVGRKYDLQMFALSEFEYSQNENNFEKLENLKERLVLGNYPELSHIVSRKAKIRYLEEIKNSYLLKDILVLDGLRNSSKIFILLRLIAFQIGSEVSYQELASQLGMSKNTVEKYLDLLTKVFVLFKLEGYSKNLRKEVSKNSKWYFYDNGIRNAVIGNYLPIEQRDDLGKLWENYMIMERIKHNQLRDENVDIYFWRTYDHQEIDLVESCNGKLSGYEFKWMPKATKAPVAWIKAYPDADFQVVDSSNFFNFVGL